jgi:hypothetical protein
MSGVKKETKDAGEFQRDGEYKYRGTTFGDFVTIRTDGSMQDVSVAGIQSTRVQAPPSPLF